MVADNLPFLWVGWTLVSGVKSGRKWPTTTIQQKNLAIYYCYVRITTFLKLEFVKLEFQKLMLFEKIYFKFARTFFMVLEFMELEYHGKLDFKKLEYPKVVDPYIFPKQC